jgi:hypothetical protein
MAKMTTPSRSKVKTALNELINTAGTASDALEYFQQVHIGFAGVGVGAGGNRNDRGAAVLLATTLENSLQFAIERKLNIAEVHRTRLFQDEGAPLRDFSAKIRMGHAIGLFGDETKDNLDFIRLIRNVFAHAPSPVNFSIHAISDACTLLKVPQPVDQADDQKAEAATGRERYQLVCERIRTALHNAHRQT